MSKAAASLIARSDEVAGTYVRKRYAILFYLLLFTFVASPVLAALHRRGQSSLSCYWRRPSRLPCFPCAPGNARRILFVLVATALAGRFLTASSW